MAQISCSRAGRPGASRGQTRLEIRPTAGRAAVTQLRWQQGGSAGPEERDRGGGARPGTRRPAPPRGSGKTGPPPPASQMRPDFPRVSPSAANSNKSWHSQSAHYMFGTSPASCLVISIKALKQALLLPPFKDKESEAQRCQ